ncbi:MAG TPA: MFS transporter [Propionibacteriaceae bacterium]|nr:MFS transporter [Propionibacteriaceae bacterium]
MKALLHSSDAVAVVVARALMMAALSVVTVSLLLRVHDSGHGPWATSAVFVVLAVPSVLGMGVAGNLADRVDSRVLLVAALAAQVVATLALGSRAGLAWTLAWLFVFEAGFVVASPVWTALVPRIVGDEGVQQVAGAQMVASSLAQPLGGAAAGLLVDRIGHLRTPLAAAALTLVVLGVTLALRTRRGGHHDPAFRTVAGGGLDHIRREPVLAALLVGSVILVIGVQGVTVVEVFLVRDSLHASASGYGLGELAFGLGSVLAGVLVARVATDAGRLRTIVGGFALTGLLCVAIGLAPDLAVYWLLLTFLGLTNAAANGCLGPLVVLRTPEHLRGRVVAAVSGVVSAASVVSLVAGGFVGTRVGPRTTFVAAGTLGVLAALAMGARVWRAVVSPGVADAARPAPVAGR